MSFLLCAGALLALGTAAWGQETMSRPRVRGALQSAREAYNRGEYAAAQLLLDRVQEQGGKLDEPEAQDLRDLAGRNRLAQSERRAGESQLLQAEDALAKGHPEEAASLVKTLSVNQYLRSEDKERLGRLNERVRAATAGTGGPGGAKESPRALMERARGALQRGDLDRAEQYAKQAARANGSWPAWLQPPWNDTPARVLREVQVARRKQAEAAAAKARPADQQDKQEASSPLMAPLNSVKNLFARTPTPKDQPAAGAPPEAPRTDIRPAAGTDTTNPGTVAAVAAGTPKGATTVHTQYRPNQDPPARPQTDQASALVQRGYEALRHNDLVTASQCAEQAQALHRKFEWWEDSPDKLLADIHRATSTVAQNASAPPAPAPKPATPAGKQLTDPRAMVREGFALLRQGKLDEADRLSLRAASVRSVRWGLFEDTPETLRVAVQKARGRKDQEESARTLEDARRAFDRGDYEEARNLAYKAKQLHGPYGRWEVGDRPDRLLAEIQSAEARRPRPHSAAANGPAGTPANPATPAGPGMVAQDTMRRALALVVEARVLQRQGRLIEARQKALAARGAALEAERAGVPIAPNDDTPPVALADLARQCQGQIAVLLRRAEDSVSAGGRDPLAFQQAAASLGQARELAVAFALDTAHIDEQAAALRNVQLAAQGQPPAPPVAQQAPPVPPSPSAQVAMPTPPANMPILPAPPLGVLPLPGVGTAAPGTAVASTPAPKTPADLRREGLEILEKARLELRANQLYPARRLGEQVFLGPYGLQAEARGFLNSLDAEEQNQKYLAVNRKFDDAHEAFAHGDYRLAKTCLAGLKGDEGLLTPDRQMRLRELGAAPEMQPGQPSAVAGGPGLRQVADAQAPGTASVSDLAPKGSGLTPKGADEELGPTERYRAMNEILFKQKRLEGLEEQRRAMASAKAKDYDTAIDILRAYVSNLDSSNLPADQLALLRRPAERRVDEYRKLKEQITWDQKLAAGLDRAEPREAKRQADKKKAQDEMGDLMKQYAALIRQSKYDEALVLAYKMKEIDPDSPAATMAIETGKIRRQLKRFNTNAEERKQYFLDSMDDAEKVGKYLDFNTPLDFNEQTTLRAKARQDLGKGIESDRRGEKERRIEQRLTTPFSLSFKDTPLKQVIEDLHNLTGVNVVADKAALEESGVSLEQPLSLKVEDMSLKSALNILLKQAKLTYVIKDEALQITTEEHAKGKLKMVTYPVADLVVPVENHSLPVVCDFNEVAKRHVANNLNWNYGGPMPWVGPNSLPAATPISNPGSGRGWAAANNGPGAPLGNPPKPPGTNATIEDLLIRLITQTVEPNTWNEVGGKGTIQYFPLGLALVINQTQDIQEQIQDLLAALRRLQDLEVAIEMRLVSVSEAFFEMMRLDFDLNITNSQARYEPQLVTQQFAPPGYINAFRPNGFFSGLTPAGTFTPDLGVPLNNSSFDFALPPFGGYPGTLGADGGLTLGLAFLSDIQVFLLLEAAQGDRRYNVMQAPKITVFNGQQAFIQVTDAQFFLTQINVIPFGAQLVFQPQNAPVFFGVTMVVTPVVSADRRFVRLNLTPQLNNLFSATVPLVPIQIPVNTLFQDNVQSVQPTIFQTFFQQPAVSTITLNTTVVIPDGGTVLLGGLKALSEGRNEFGPPVLSKIPYVNRLFKNVGYGRETQSLMVLVTARIIINEEEEQIYLGNLPPIPR